MWRAFLLLGGLWAAVNVVLRDETPRNLDDICAIFEDKRGWYDAATKSEQHWGTPKHVQMSIIRQESSFKNNARSPQTKLLGFIPWKRQSTAYGYAQALDKTWLRYKNATARQYADRDDSHAAIDYVGWYTHL